MEKERCIVQGVFFKIQSQKNTASCVSVLVNWSNEGTSPESNLVCTAEETSLGSFGPNHGDVVIRACFLLPVE